MAYTVTFRAPAVEAKKVEASFSHFSESPVIDGAGKFARPARKAGKILEVTTSSESVAKMLCEILAKDFDDVAVTES